MSASHFGQKVRALREAQGLSLARLAEIAGCSKASMWTMERKPLVGRWSPEKIARIAGALHVTPEFLLSEDSSLEDHEDTIFLNRYRHSSRHVRRQLALILGVLEQ